MKVQITPNKVARLWVDAATFDPCWRGLLPEVLEWLDEHTPTWKAAQPVPGRHWKLEPGDITIEFSTEAEAVLFKLRWE